MLNSLIERRAFLAKVPLFRELAESELERIAQDVRDAVLEEFHVKDTDYDYRYRVFSDDGGPAFQFADTDAEIWKALFLARGHVLDDTRSPSPK